jgi:hypothetical protein
MRRNRIMDAEKAKAVEEIRQDFKKRIDFLKELQTIAKVRLDDYTNHKPPSTYMNAKWSWTVFQMSVDNLVSVWQWIQFIMEGIVEDEEDMEVSKAQIDRLHAQFMKYSPMLQDFSDALEESKRIREKFR